jgi:hypothetical protein
MNVRNLVTLAVVWVLSLVGVAVWAQGNPQGAPQTQEWLTVQPASPNTPVITGENIGFRPTMTPGDRPGKVSGTIVVKINGQWLEVVPAMGITR